MRMPVVNCSTALIVVLIIQTAMASEKPGPPRPAPYPVVPPMAYQNATKKSTRTDEGVPGSKYWMNSAKYVLTARLYPTTKELQGTGEITYSNHSPDTLRALFFSLAQNHHKDETAKNIPAENTGGVTIRSLSFNGKIASVGGTAAPRYNVNGTVVVVVPDSPIPPGATARLGVDWEFKIPKVGAGGRMGYDTDSLFYLAYWYPQMNVYDDVVGWQNDQFLGVGEFYADFANYDLTLEAPVGWIVHSTGTLTNQKEVYSPLVMQRLAAAERSDSTLRILDATEYGQATATANDGWLRWKFRADRVRDVAWVATQHSIWESARASVGDRDGDKRNDYTVVHSFWRPNATRWVNSVRYMQHAVTFLSEYTGIPYPWPHMTAIEAAAIIGGGMEYPMMTLIGGYTNAHEANVYEVFAHEIGHMWVPMIVSTDERRYGWMDEGLTAFHTIQAMADFNPEWKHASPFHSSYLNFARAGGDGEIMRRMDYYYSLSHIGPLLYGKPSWALTGLRAVLGPERFDVARRTLLADWAWKHPYPWDMFKAFERAAGEPMDWFFRPWYYDNWKLDHALVGVEQRAEATVITVEDRGLLPMPAVLTVTFADGSSMKEQIPVEEWLSGKTRASVFVSGTRKVVKVELDMDQEYPDVDRANNTWSLE
jgi:hypothetical protein